MEKPMAAVLNELVAQRKAMHSMMMEMQPAMMAHMMHHMHMQGAKGSHGLPDDEGGQASEPKQRRKALDVSLVARGLVMGGPPPRPRRRPWQW